jgi:hypothetical protein
LINDINRWLVDAEEELSTQKVACMFLMGSDVNYTGTRKLFWSETN